MPFGAAKTPAKKTPAPPPAADSSDVELSADDLDHWPKGYEQFWKDIGPFTGLRFEEVLDLHVLTESLQAAQREFFKLTASIEWRMAADRGPRLFWTRPAATPEAGAQLPPDSGAGDVVHALEVATEVMDHAGEWDRCVREVCPAAHSRAWGGLPGCDSSKPSGKPPQYYYLLHSVDGKCGCVLFFIWHHVIGDFHSQHTFLLRWSEIYARLQQADTPRGPSIVHSNPVPAVSSDSTAGVGDSWWVGKYVANNLDEAGSGDNAREIPSFPGDCTIVLTEKSVMWLNRCIKKTIPNGTDIVAPVSLPFLLLPNASSCTISEGGDTCKFEFSAVHSPNLTLRWSGISTSTEATVTYEKKPPLTVGVFTLGEHAVTRLKTDFPPVNAPFLSTNDLLMAQFAVAVAPLRRERLIKSGRMPRACRIVCIPIYVNMRRSGRAIREGKVESAGKHSGREEEEGKGEGSKVDEWLEADYFGNGSMTVNLVASWDILLGGDVVAIAELLRAQLLLATERDDEGCTSGQKVWAHVCTREQLKDLLQLDLSEEELQLPPLLVSEWNSSIQICKQIFAHASFGTAAGLQELIPLFERRRATHEPVWFTETESVFVRVQQPGQVALAVVGSVEEWPALESAFGARRDWGLYN